MGTSDLTKFVGGSQDKGLNNFESQISAEINWSSDTVNVSGGIRRGAGVRYGTAPLAGHSNTEVPAGTATNGIQLSETTSGTQGLIQRRQIFGIVPITMAPYDGTYPKANQQFYAYIVGLNFSTATSLDVCLGAILSSSVNKQANTFVAGLAQSSYRQESPLVRQHKTEFLNLPTITTPVAADMQSTLTVQSGNNWIPWAHISVSGKRIPYFWMLGRANSTPNGTTAPNLNLWQVQFSSGATPIVLGGEPSEIETRECIDNVTRNISVYCLDANGYRMDLSYNCSITNANTQPQTAYNTSGNNYFGLTALKGGASTAYGSVAAAVINDSGSFTNSRHEAVLMAGEIPIAIVYQDWLKAVKGMMPRWIDLSNPASIPRVLGAPFPYNNGQSMAFNFPDLYFGGADTGVLKASTTYDFGFSTYNKLLDYETNVVYGVTAVSPTGNMSSVAFDIPDSVSNNSVFENMMLGSGGGLESPHAFPWEWTNGVPKVSSPPVEPGRGFHVNDFQYRLYFRENGTNEWLPGGNMDAAQYWFYGDWKAIGGNAMPTFCLGPVGQLPGGQPNGFVDYSPLPKQQYICTQVFQQRAFWWSEKTMQFSYANNIYAYPTRNITTVPSGKWRGGIVCSQKDLSQQLSRLVVFCDNAYSARFTGNLTQQSVRISADTVGQFAVDGSDFTMEYLSDSTAYSYRAAVVGNGILYWWGPQGVYMDDGTKPPQKLSKVPLEPDIFSYVDTELEKEVIAVFNKRSAEVIWFYPPKDGDTDFPTHGLVYNTENGEFYPFKFPYKVDSAQNIKIENDQTPEGVAGERVLIHCRETSSDTIQRTFYLDNLVLAGDQSPNTELTVISISTPVAGTRRLTLAAGSVGITAGGIAVNDLISFQNVKGYAPSLTAATDMLAKVTAINNGSSYLEISLPDGGALDSSATLTGQTAFPIYQMKPAAAGLHGITYLMQTNYWMPDGVANSWIWQYLYFLFRFLGLPTPTDPFTGTGISESIALTYRSLVCEGAISDTLTLVNNSDGNCQIHHPLRNAGRAALGQALKYALSGIHIGNPWTLEYLEAHCRPENGFTLKEFEG